MMFVATCLEIFSLGRGDWVTGQFGSRKPLTHTYSNHTISALGSHTESTTASNPVQIILLGRRKKNTKKTHNTLKHPVSFAKTLASQDLQTATKTEYPTNISCTTLIPPPKKNVQLKIPCWMEDHNWSPQISNRDITPETNDSWHVPVVFVGLSWMRKGPCLGWHYFKKTHPKTSQCLTMFEHLWPKCSEVASDTCTEVFHGPDVLACLSMRTLSCNESTNIKDSSTCTSNKNLSKQPIGILRTASSCIYGILYIRFFWPAARRCHVQEGLWRSKCVKSQSGTLSSQDRAPPKTHRDSNQVTVKHANPVNHEPWNSGCFMTGSLFHDLY